MQLSKHKWIFNWLITFSTLTAAPIYRISYDAAFIISNKPAEEWQMAAQSVSSTASPTSTKKNSKSNDFQTP